MNTYKVFVCEGPKKIAAYTVEKREPAADEVSVKVDSCAICTLEQRFYTGVMTKYPFALGHEVSGIVEAVGSHVRSVKSGDKVAVRLLNSCGECYYCRNGHENQCVVSFLAHTQPCAVGPGGMAEYMIVPAKSVYKMASDADCTHIALTEPLACCVHSISNAHVSLADDVVVVGVGIMGAFHIQLAKLCGARVIACEVDDARLAVAKKMGADFTINSKKENAAEKVLEYTEGRGADAVFCTVAIPAVAQDCLAMASKLGRIVFYSSFHPDNPIQVNPNKIHSTEQIITGSVNPQIKDFSIASRLISNKLIDTASLISECIPCDRIQEAFEKAIDPTTFRIVVRF
ncbi:zinc-dependent alcohol dehydrogenase [Treponema maltophilum]|uniref:zinc-dependent alcohol dehydrogenase n=1 Tax=Treponema maltophilum TaxID=51160 RepID=UPI003D92F09F